MDRKLFEPKPTPVSPDPVTVYRKMIAKRANERTKSIYAFANGLGVTTITVGAITPAIRFGTDRLDLDAPTWIAFGVSLHIFGWAIIRLFWVSEE